MTEEQKATNDMPDAEAPRAERSGSELLNELETLGQELATAIKSLWDSDESRKLRKDIGAGFVELGHRIDEAVQSAQESDTAKHLSEQVKETVTKARESDVAGKMEAGLVAGLRELNIQLSKVVDSVVSEQPNESKTQPGPDTDPGAEDQA